MNKTPETLGEAPGDLPLPRRTARGLRSSLENCSSIAGVLERRRAAQVHIDDLLRGVSPAGQAMPRRVNGELGFILHAWDWSESSLLLDVLTARFGRVFLVARGARRASSQYRGLLTAFVPLRFTWTGQKEAKMLVSADWLGTMVPLTGESLLSGFYVNELVLKLTEREDCHPGLFEAYARAIHDLALGEREAVQPALRRFETAILTAAGWAPAKTGNTGAEYFEVREGTLYGLEPGEDTAGGTAFSRRSVEALLTGEIPAGVMREARGMLRELIEYHLGGRTLNSRRILTELHTLAKV